MKTTTEPAAKLNGSPWGMPESITGIAPGIFIITTASHGGYYLAPPQWARLKALFPSFQPFARVDGWLEEDCDAVLAPLVFPEFFDNEALFFAVHSVRGMGLSMPRFSDAVRYLATDAATPIMQRAAKFAEENPDALKRG